MEKLISLSIPFRIIALVLLGIALLKLPYGYYILLRWVVCGVGLLCAYISYEIEKNTWVVLFGIIALLFNPIIPIHLNKEIWSIINVAVVLVIFISFFVINKKSIQ
jgi:hypothetical protein